MDLLLFTQGDWNTHPTKELIEFHREKMLSDYVTDSLRVVNLRHFLEVSREYRAQLSLSTNELFAGCLYEGYCTTTQNLYPKFYSRLSGLSEAGGETEAGAEFTEDEQQAFTQFQMTIAFLLRNNYSNLVTYMDGAESEAIREKMIQACVGLLNNSNLSSENRFNIADCLLNSTDKTISKLGQSFIDKNRGSKNVYGVIETDSQNVHSKTVNLVTKRKLIEIAKDELPTKLVFYQSIYPHLIPGSSAGEQYAQAKKVKPQKADQSLLIAPENAKTRWLGYSNPDGSKMTPEQIAALPTVKVKIYFGVLDRPIHPSSLPDLEEMTNTENTSVAHRIKVAFGLAADPTSKQQFNDASIVLQSYFDTIIVGYPTKPDIRTKVEKALQRIENDSVIYESMTLSNIFQRVLNRVFKMRDKEFFGDLIQRVYEEVTDSEGLCASGYVSRLLNILSGYPEIDINISESRVDEISEMIREQIKFNIMKSSNSEALEESMIGITPEERKLFTAFCSQHVQMWHAFISRIFKSTDRYDDLFEEEFNQSVWKTCAIEYPLKQSSFVKWAKDKMFGKMASTFLG